MIAMAGLVAACAGGNAVSDAGGVVPSGATAGPRVTAGRGTQVTLTRASSLVYVGVPATVKINGEQVANLYAGASSTVPVAPGPNKITVEAFSYPGNWEIDLSVRPGKTYAIQIEPRDGSIGVNLLGVAALAVAAAQASNGKNTGAFQMRVVN